MKDESSYPEIKDESALIEACANLKKLAVCGEFTAGEQSMVCECFTQNVPDLEVIFLASETQAKQWLCGRAGERPIVLLVPDSFPRDATLHKLQELFYNEDVYTIGQISRKILVGNTSFSAR